MMKPTNFNDDDLQAWLTNYPAVDWVADNYGKYFYSQGQQIAFIAYGDCIYINE